MMTQNVVLTPETYYTIKRITIGIGIGDEDIATLKEFLKQVKK